MKKEQPKQFKPKKYTVTALVEIEFKNLPAESPKSVKESVTKEIELGFSSDIKSTVLKITAKEQE